MLSGVTLFFRLLGVGILLILSPIQLWWMIETTPEWAIRAFGYLSFGAYAISIVVGVILAFVSWKHGAALEKMIQSVVVGTVALLTIQSVGLSLVYKAAVAFSIPLIWVVALAVTSWFIGNMIERIDDGYPLLSWK